jgi:hypothetical protein
MTRTTVLLGSQEQDGDIITVALHLQGAGTPTFVRFNHTEIYFNGTDLWPDVVANEIEANTGKVEIIVL